MRSTNERIGSTVVGKSRQTRIIEGEYGFYLTADCLQDERQKLGAAIHEVSVGGIP